MMIIEHFHYLLDKRNDGLFSHGIYYYYKFNRTYSLYGMYFLLCTKINNLQYYFNYKLKIKKIYIQIRSTYF
jgi:hypothetical protein